MQTGDRPSPGGRTRRAGRLPGVQMLVLAFGLVAAGALAGAQETRPVPAAGGTQSVVGVWHAALPNGLRTATITLVPQGAGLAGAFVGYDYGGPVDFTKPLEGPPPKVSIRSGALLVEPRLDVNTVTFKLVLRHPMMPPEAKGVEITGEMKVTGEAGELKLTAPNKPEPLNLKLTRE